MDNDDVVVKEFQKNSRELVRVQLRHWQGKDLIDFRVCYVGESGEWKPGPKGLCLQRAAFPDLKAAMLALEKVLAGRGSKK